MLGIWPGALGRNPEQKNGGKKFTPSFHNHKFVTSPPLAGSYTQWAEGMIL